MLGAVGEDLELVPRVEVHEIAPGFSLLEKLAPPLKGKDTLDEVLAKPRLVKTAVLFDREQGEMLHKHTGKYADPLFLRDPFLVVNPDPFHT